MSEAFDSFEKVRALLQDEEACARVLYEAKWPNGFRCPSCGHDHAYPIATRRLPLYECSRCSKQTSLIVGTVFQGTRTPLHLWFQAIWLHSRPGSINALQLSKEIHVTYKTAWLICHKLRHAMSGADADELLTGAVRLTDACIYHRVSSNMKWHRQEQSVLIGATDGENGEPENVKIKKQDKSLLRHRLEAPGTSSFIIQHVAPEARMSINFVRQYSRERHHALLKIGREVEKWLAELFRGIGPKHFQAYLNHYCYDWNRRKTSRFGDLLRWCAATRTITYPVLTKRPSKARSGRRPRSATAIKAVG
ncbi:transposase [Cohnella zeiphila]|uniref:Transposase n=1 Tax=Cohnella zeiphila TaxID=2761120 RepID=A0A7X0VWK0_9BACL|nr:transposase [Cohnella zeiphila]MBB6733041.1 transposase [Cohnella zeiphila]